MALYSSPSQCVTFERCNRAWWFQKVKKLYAPSNTSQEFGTALHMLCAAYLEGKTVSANWAKALKPNEITQAERIVQRAIEEGVLKYRPGLLVEHKFSMPVGGAVENGIIDCLDLNGVVEDHKTAASDRWIKTQADLRADMPMMIYAGYLLTKAKPTKVWLRHNQFIMNNESVTFTEVAVTPDEVRDFWRARVIPTLRGQQNVISLPQWNDVSGHDKGSEPCKAYKGCPYEPICHGGVPLDKFEFQKSTGDLPF